MFVIALLVGLALLTLGRKIYWLFVAGVGFVLGIELAIRFLHGQPDWVILILGLLAGLFGALLASFLQQLAIGLAGFAAGAIVAISVLRVFGIDSGILYWVILLVGGAAGAAMVALLFDWSLISLSSLVGAAIIVQYLPVRQMEPIVMALIFVVILIAGIVVQNTLWKSEKSG